MIFVMEEQQALATDLLIRAHLNKLKVKGYMFDDTYDYRIATAGDFKYLQLPYLRINDVTLLTTVCKIQEELGELTQLLGKGTKASGEADGLSPDVVRTGCALELLDIAQCCFTMMYILREKYQVDMTVLIERHVDKLRRKGYCA